MEDLGYVIATVAFFVLMAGLVIGCERIVGDVDEAVAGGEQSAPAESVVIEDVSA